MTTAHLQQEAKANGDRRRQYKRELDEMYAQTRELAPVLRADGLSVADIAYLLGVSPGRISQILHEQPTSERANR